MIAKVGVGIIGLGWMGRIHAKLSLLNEDAHLIAVCDTDGRRLESCMQTFQTDGYHDYRALLDRKDIDAIFLVTPPTVRFPILRDCVEAGKDILCEKPLAITTEELGAIRGLLQKNGIRFMICFPERFAISFQEAKDLVDQGLIGSIDYIRANFRFSMKKHGDLHGGWVFNRQLGGGLIVESSVHLWDAIRWMTGKEVTQVLGLAHEVCGQGSVFEDNFVAVANLEGATLACVDMSGSLPVDTPTDKRFEILGSAGCIYVDEFRHFLMVNTEKGVEANPGDFVKGMTHPDIMWHSHIEGGVKRLQKEFLRCVLEDRPPRPGLEDGARATEITLAVVRSLSSKKMETVHYGA
jgi:predicted dehydrogenase